MDRTSGSTFRVGEVAVTVAGNVAGSRAISTASEKQAQSSESSFFPHLGSSTSPLVSLHLVVSPLFSRGMVDARLQNISSVTKWVC